MILIMTFPEKKTVVSTAKSTSTVLTSHHAEGTKENRAGTLTYSYSLVKANPSPSDSVLATTTTNKPPLVLKCKRTAAVFLANEHWEQCLQMNPHSAPSPFPGCLFPHRRQEEEALAQTNAPRYTESHMKNTPNARGGMKVWTIQEVQCQGPGSAFVPCSLSQRTSGHTTHHWDTGSPTVCVMTSSLSHAPSSTPSATPHCWFHFTCSTWELRRAGTFAHILRACYMVKDKI